LDQVLETTMTAFAIHALSLIMLEPLLSESLQEYLARHDRKLGDGRPETPALVARWRTGPAWVRDVKDWRTHEQRRQDAIRARDHLYQEAAE
jgi:hypothetical protein